MNSDGDGDGDGTNKRAQHAGWAQAQMQQWDVN
jgi:hypothetical protein